MGCSGLWVSRYDATCEGYFTQCRYMRGIFFTQRRYDATFGFHTAQHPSYVAALREILLPRCGVAALRETPLKRSVVASLREILLPRCVVA